MIAESVSTVRVRPDTDRADGRSKRQKPGTGKWSGGLGAAPTGDVVLLPAGQVVAGRHTGDAAADHEVTAAALPLPVQAQAPGGQLDVADTEPARRQAHRGAPQVERLVDDADVLER